MTILDLHNHTCRSYDSSILLSHYERAYARGLFDVLGITDHNTIKGAQDFKRGSEFPVIVGEEVDTADGELIGLFLDGPLTLDQSAVWTACEIREMQGLVYLQHPYYQLLRKPLAQRIIDELIHRELVDIIEVANGGALMRGVPGFQSLPFVGRMRLLESPNKQAKTLAMRVLLTHPDVREGAGSDAHHPSDIGRCVVETPLPVPARLTKDWVLDALREGEVVQKRIRHSLLTLAARASYSLKMSVLAKTDGVPRTQRRP